MSEQVEESSSITEQADDSEFAFASSSDDVTYLSLRAHGSIADGIDNLQDPPTDSADAEVLKSSEPDMRSVPNHSSRARTNLSLRSTFIFIICVLFAVLCC